MLTSICIWFQYRWIGKRDYFLMPCFYVSETRRYVLDWTIMCIILVGNVHNCTPYQSQNIHCIMQEQLTHSQQTKSSILLLWILSQVTQIGQTIDHFFLLLGSHCRYAELQYFFLLTQHCTRLKNENDCYIDLECQQAFAYDFSVDEYKRETSS